MRKDQILQYLKFCTKRLKEKRTFFLILSSFTLVFLLGLLLSSDLYFLYLNNKANAFFRDGDVDKALVLYKKAEGISDDLGYIATGNNGTVLYNSEDYSEAFEKFLSIAKKECGVSLATSTQDNVLKTKKYCDQLLYNTGNTFYRLGELIETANLGTATGTNTQVQRSLWVRSIQMYQNDLAINADDFYAQENIDFILKKLNSSNPDEQKQQSQENDEQKDDQENDQNQDAGSDSENGQSDEGSEGGSEGENGQQKSAQEQKEDNTKLNDATSKQLDAYMQKIDRQSKDYQKYFKQNPNAQQSAGNNLFNDPFFQDFFEGAFENSFSSGQKSLEKDW